jgi:hypothetical protein
VKWDDDNGDDGEIGSLEQKENTKNKDRVKVRMRESVKDKTYPKG